MCFWVYACALWINSMFFLSLFPPSLHTEWRWIWWVLFSCTHTTHTHTHTHTHQLKVTSVKRSTALLSSVAFPAFLSLSFTVIALISWSLFLSFFLFHLKTIILLGSPSNLVSVSDIVNMDCIFINSAWMRDLHAGIVRCLFPQVVEALTVTLVDLLLQHKWLSLKMWVQMAHNIFVKI